MRLIFSNAIRVVTVCGGHEAAPILAQSSSQDVNQILPLSTSHPESFYSWGYVPDLVGGLKTLAQTSGRIKPNSPVQVMVLLFWNPGDATANYARIPMASVWHCVSL